jgi:hypothetical protein
VNHDPPIKCVIRSYPCATIQIFKKTDFDPDVGAVAGAFSILLDPLNRPIMDKITSLQAFAICGMRVIHAMHATSPLDVGDVACLILHDQILMTGIFLGPQHIMSPGTHLACWLTSWFAVADASATTVWAEFMATHPAESLVQELLEQHEPPPLPPLYNSPSMN